MFSAHHLPSPHFPEVSAFLCQHPQHQTCPSGTTWIYQDKEAEGKVLMLTAAFAIAHWHFQSGPRSTKARWNASPTHGHSKYQDLFTKIELVWEAYLNIGKKMFKRNVGKRGHPHQKSLTWLDHWAYPGMRATYTGGKLSVLNLQSTPRFICCFPH